MADSQAEYTCPFCNPERPREHLLNERQELVMGLRTQGMSYLEIGQRLGIGRARAWQIYRTGAIRIYEAHPLHAMLRKPLDTLKAAK